MKQLVARKYAPPTGFTSAMIHGEVTQIGATTVIELTQGKRKIYLEKSQATDMLVFLNRVLK